MLELIESFPPRAARLCSPHAATLTLADLSCASNLLCPSCGAVGHREEPEGQEFPSYDSGRHQSLVPPSCTGRNNPCVRLWVLVCCPFSMGVCRSGSFPQSRVKPKEKLINESPPTKVWSSAGQPHICLCLCSRVHLTSPHTPGKNYEQRDSRNTIPRGTQAGFDKQAEQQG